MERPELQDGRRVSYGRALCYGNGDANRGENCHTWTAGDQPVANGAQS